MSCIQIINRVHNNTGGTLLYKNTLYSMSSIMSVREGSELKHVPKSGKVHNFIDPNFEFWTFIFSALIPPPFLTFPPFWANF